MLVSDIIERCETLYHDLSLGYVKDWKSRTGGCAIGYLPIYVPRELIHAAGMLPVGIMGGGDQIEIIRGDSIYQSYICHIPRSVVELGITGRLSALDGMLFPSICDVIRNLSGIWKLLFPETYSRYFDTPQNFNTEVGGKFYLNELRSIAEDLNRLGGVEITADRLNKSIALYNENRSLVRQLYDMRAEKPWSIPTDECYLLLRAGNILSVNDHNRMLVSYIDSVNREDRRPMDNARVIICGAFCEQPPLGMIRLLERSGCYIVDDDFVLVSRWLLDPIDDTTSDPLRSIAHAFIDQSTTTAAKFLDSGVKGAFLIDRVKHTRADGVIFCAPSFCDPALLEQPMLQNALENQGIAYTQFKYSENTGQFQVIGEQAGTFADSIKLWGTA